MKLVVGFIDRECPNHKHNDYEIIVYTKGRGKINLSGKEYEVSPGKIMIVPPETMHQSVIIDDIFERIYISGDFNNLLFEKNPILITDTPDNEGMLLGKMIYSNRYADVEYLSSLVNALVHFLVRNMKMEDHVYIAVKNIVDKISDTFSDSNIDLSEILKRSGYAEDYIRAQFKKIMGKTPTTFLTEVRINHARFLIDMYKTTYSLSTVAEKCGYDDYVYFSRRFKQITGMSPRKYMEMN